MNVQLFLDDHVIFPWYKSDAGCIRGYILLDDGKEISGQDALNYLKNELFNANWNHFQKWNGCFSAVILDHDKGFAISDGISSFPLFYAKANEELMISDDGRKLTTSGNDINNTNTRHFEFFSICPGRDTLLNGVFQLLAGELLTWDNENISIRQHGNLGRSSLAKSQGIQNVWDKVLDKLLSREQPTKWLLPLSGGWDSRLLLASLLDRGVRNIVTYTYGSKDSFEVHSARSVANKLGVEWHFVEYDNECLSAFWNPDIQSFFLKECKGAFSIQEQELFALLQLKEQGIIGAGYRALPGYCCDLLAGSYTIPGIREVEHYKKEIAMQWIRAKHLSFVQSPERIEEAERLLLPQLFDGDFKTMGEWMNHYEKWFTQQKVSKYILSGLRSFEFMGIEWRLPYWDREWMNLWYDTNLEERWNRTLFKEWANHRYFIPMQIQMSEDQRPGFVANGWKERLRLRYSRTFTLLKKIAFWKKSMDINNAKYLKESICGYLEQRNISPILDELNPMIAQFVLSEFRFKK